MTSFERRFRELVRKHEDLLREMRRVISSHASASADTWSIEQHAEDEIHKTDLIIDALAARLAQHRAFRDAPDLES